jgi:hypothetical protein
MTVLLVRLGMQGLHVQDASSPASPSGMAPYIYLAFVSFHPGKRDSYFNVYRKRAYALSHKLGLQPHVLLLGEPAESERGPRGGWDVVLIETFGSRARLMELMGNAEYANELAPIRNAAIAPRGGGGPPQARLAPTPAPAPLIPPPFDSVIPLRGKASLLYPSIACLTRRVRD